MALEQRKPLGLTGWPLSLPATIMAGALLAGLSAILLCRWPDSLVPFRVVLIVGALCAGGLAIWWRLASLEDEFEERIWAAVLVAVGAGLILCCRAAMDESWDSLRMALRVFTFVAGAGAVVLLLPRVGRRVVASLLVLFHFGGITTAVLAVAPHNGQPAPWLPTTIWNVVYRPYLQFAYLNNAYHFYSPEPGPPMLVWFLVEFEGEGKNKPDPQWLKLISREDCSTRLKYQRMLALTESTNQYNYAIPSMLKLEALARRRRVAGALHKPEPIPMSEFFDLQFQYKEPTKLTKIYLGSYVRHVARTVRSSQDPDAKVKRIKVYRLVHQIINAPQLKQGLTPTDPIFYLAYFEGEYNPDGQLVPTTQPDLVWLERRTRGSADTLFEKGQDPFLYWMLPIYRAPKREGGTLRTIDDSKVIDCLKIHAGWPTGLGE
jgi:hypothetical protein